MTTTPPTETLFYNGIVGTKQTITVQATGKYIYLTVASGALFFKPSGGSWILLYAGMDIPVPASFKTMQIYNPTPNGVTYQFIVSNERIGDNRQIPSIATPTIVKPTLLSNQGPAVCNHWSASTGNASATLLDSSGLTFYDINGTAWLGVQRLGIYMQALAEGFGDVNGLAVILGYGMSYSQELTIVEVPPISQGTTAMPIVPPPVVFNAAGNFNVFSDNVGNGSQAYVAVYELYQAVQPNSAAYQPPN